MLTGDAMAILLELRRDSRDLGALNAALRFAPSRAHAALSALEARGLVIIGSDSRTPSGRWAGLSVEGRRVVHDLVA